MKATKQSQKQQVERLVRICSETDALLVQLEVHLRERLEAMRAAAMDRIATASKAEEELQARIQLLERQRDRVVQDIAANVGLASQKGRPVTFKILADRLNQEEAAELRKAMESLRERLRSVAQLQEIVNSVGQSVVGHLKAVLGPISPDAPNVYSARGAVVGGSTHLVFEAVG